MNKSDKADAEGHAQIAQMNWFTPVHIRSEESDRLRTLVGGREHMIRLRKDLEGHIRGVLKAFGIRMTGVGQHATQPRYIKDRGVWIFAVGGRLKNKHLLVRDGSVANFLPCQVDVRRSMIWEGIA